MKYNLNKKYTWATYFSWMSTEMQLLQINNDFRSTLMKLNELEEKGMNQQYSTFLDTN